MNTQFTIVLFLHKLDTIHVYVARFVCEAMSRSVCGGGGPLPLDWKRSGRPDAEARKTRLCHYAIDERTRSQRQKNPHSDRGWERQPEGGRSWSFCVHDGKKRLVSGCRRIIYWG